MMARICLVVCLLLARAAAAGQSVTGVVQDSSGAAIESAVVTVMDEDTGVRRAVQTGADGSYGVSALPAGVYRVTVRKPGFQTIVRWSVRVEPATELRLEFLMIVGSMRNVITVEGARPNVNVNDASVGTAVDGDAARRLPVSGRGVLSLIELAPGIVATPAANGEAGQFSANGLRANTNYFTIDGVAANTGVGGGGLPAQFAGNALPAMTAFGSTQNLVSTEALDEVRVLTSSFAPEHGRLPGAQVALTSRSGTERYHGSAFYTLRNEALAANDWFANASGNGAQPLRLNQWGATAGGPLRRDRTFVFASYEALRLVQPFTRTFLTPSAAARAAAQGDARAILNAFPAPDGPAVSAYAVARTAVFSRPSRLDTEGVRIDHALSDRLTLFGRYNRAPSYTESGFSQMEHFALSSTSVTVGVTATPAPEVTNDLRTNSWSTTAESAWSVNPGAGGAPIDFAAVFHQPPTPTPSFYGIGIGGAGALYSGQTGKNHQAQWNLIDTLAIRRTSHDIRFGLDYQRLTPTRQSAAQSVVGRSNGLADLVAGVPPALLTVRAEQASALIETLSAFAQDTWSVTPRLNVTFGLRWELTPAPSMRQPSAAFTPQPAPPFGGTVLSYAPVLPTTDELWQTRYTQFAPRVGAAFRAGRSSVLRAGWGVFYDVAFSTVLDPINGFPFNRWQFGSSGLAGAGASTVAAGDFGLRYAPDLKLPYAQHWNVAYERTLGVANVISASFVGSAGRRLLRYEGIAQLGTPLAQYLVATNHGDSIYNGLELQYKRKLARGVQGIAAYTWSHAIDNGSNDSGVWLAGPPASADRGSSSFDVRQNFTAGLTWVAPASTRRMRWLADGWELSTMLRARSGFPIDVLTTENLLGLGFDNYRRPDLVPGVPVWIPDPTIGGRRLNPAAFAIPTTRQGALGRNAITGAGMSQIDLSLERRFSLKGPAGITFRVEAYNVLNHPNPGDPVRFLDNPLFGAPVSMLDLMLGSGTARSGLAPAFQIGGPRSLQALLRFRF